MILPVKPPEPIHRGKVRDTYELPDPNLLLMVATDRISVFDVVLNQPVPGKGVVLTHMTEHWFRDTPVRFCGPNHLVTTDLLGLPEWAQQFQGRGMVVRRAEMLPIEFIVRGYLTGSAWASYNATGSINGAQFDPGLEEMHRFVVPLFTPSTKAEHGQHDENISVEEMTKLLGNETLAMKARHLCINIYATAAKYARERGIILVDTKIELGLIDGQLVICDEVLTPDSSRYVDASTFTPGKPPKSMDKEFVRQWALGTGWNKQPPAPDLPLSVILQTAEIYGDIAERLTGSNPIIS